MPIFIFGMVISSLFSFGALNSFEIDNSDYIIPFKDVYGLNKDINDSSKSKVNAKSKYKKTGTLSVRAKCSCSLLTDYGSHRAQWVNYCPQCHKYGTLRFTRGGGCPEGMLYCTRCDADFCSVHGREHVYGSATYLRSA